MKKELRTIDQSLSLTNLIGNRRSSSFLAFPHQFTRFCLCGIIDLLHHKLQKQDLQDMLQEEESFKREISDSMSLFAAFKEIE